MTVFYKLIIVFIMLFFFLITLFTYLPKIHAFIILGVILIIIAYSLFGFPVKKIHIFGLLKIYFSHKEIIPTNFNKKAVELIISQKENYEKTQTYQQGKLHRQVYVGVKNNNKNNALTNCKLILSYVNSKEQIRKILLEDTFDILPQKERYIRVAAYGESINKDTPADQHIALCIRPSGYFGNEMPTSDKKHIICLRLEDHENILAEINCYLWVNNGKLTLEKV